MISQFSKVNFPDALNATLQVITTLLKVRLEKHKSTQSSFGLSTQDDGCDLPSMYWITKLG